MSEEYASQTLTELRRSYLAGSTDAMPIAGLLCWAILSAVAFIMGSALPYWAILIAPAAPLPVSIMIDKLRKRPPAVEGSAKHPMTQLFMRFISVIGVMVFFVIVAARGSESLVILALGVGLLSGVIWVPHGWAADDPAGFIQFILRAALCFAAYMLVPNALAVAAIAAAVALSYLHAIIFMKKPESA